MDNLVILGSKGFLGRNIIDYFSTRNNYKIFPLSRNDLDFCDPEEIEKTITQLKPKVIIHAAVSLDNYENNIRMYYALENIAKLTNKVILIGSGAEYISNRYKPLMNEQYFPDHPVLPKDIYSLSKYTISRLHQNSKINNIYNLRVFGIYGPYEDYKRRLISNNIVRHLKGLPLQYNRNVGFDYLYIDDFNMALERFIELTKPKYKTYNLCIGKAYKFKEIIETIADVVKVPKSSIVLKDTTPSNYEYSGDSSLIESEIGKVEHTTLFESINRLYNWYNQQDKVNLILE